MRAMRAMVRTELVLFCREPAAVFFTLVFPVLVLLIFGSVFGQYPNARVDRYVPALAAMVIGTVGLIGIPVSFVPYRQFGVLRRLRATPLRPWVILTAYLLTQLLATLAGIALLVVTAWLVFGLRAPRAPVGVAAALLLATLGFFATGFVLAAVLPTVRVAAAVGQATFLPMLFLSGAALPRQQLPPLLHHISDALPLTYVVTLLQRLWVDGQWSLTAVAVLAGMTVAGVALTSRLFRWQ
jgi:ABC-2 type transport system permease protein